MICWGGCLFSKFFVLVVVVVGVRVCFPSSFLLFGGCLFSKFFVVVVGVCFLSSFLCCCCGACFFFPSSFVVVALVGDFIFLQLLS